MNADRFLEDLLLIPEYLDRLATSLRDDEVTWRNAAPRRIRLVGMGSSYFASLIAAGRMRSHGLDAVAERASARAGWPPASDLLVVAVSATGESIETLAAIEKHLGISQVVALTNAPTSSLAERADYVVPMLAGTESGGVSCRTFRHTIVALENLLSHLTQSNAPVDLVRRSAEASANLLGRRDDWLAEIDQLLDTDAGTWLLAPQDRISSALQGALMIREGPRRRADGCETADWSHVDVYLTKTLDYRAIVFTGSTYDRQAADWMIERNSTSVAVGGSFPGAGYELRFPSDDDPDVALLTEVLIPELLAARWWLRPT